MKKQKSTLKDKIKNFFDVSSIEKDLKEEPTKKFEKVNLFTLTKNKLFLGILLFLLIINILVGFDINQFYIRAILSFIFLITIPGLLIMLVLKIRELGFWEYLVYVVGLSISFIMFGGLAINWILPWLNITDKPLATFSILICFNIFLVGFWVVAWIRNKNLKPLKINFPKLDLTNRIFFIVPMLFPILSILGAFLLNNHGTNILTMILLGAIAVYILLLVIFSDKLNPNIYPWAILMISLALLLSFSMRSWYVTGWDLKQEQYVFRLASENHIWSMNLYNNAYNACLSLSILPSIMNFFIKVNNQFIFKLFFQIIFIFHSLTIFLILKKYVKSILAFTASFLYFGTVYYNYSFPILARQEIAFIFFGLMLLVLFTKGVNSTLKKALFLIFGASMIVSHYSTSYIALAIFTLTYIFTLIHKIYNNRKIKNGKLHSSQKREFYLNGLLILLLLVFGFFWLAQMTNVSEGIIYTIKTTYQNIGSTLSFDLKQSSIQGALFGQSKVKKYTSKELNDYINETESIFKSSNPYSQQQTQIYSPKIINREIVYPKNQKLVYPSFYLYRFIKYLIIISFVLGSLFIYLSKKDMVDKEFSFMIALSVIFMFSMISLPYISKAYGFGRLFQQCLIFLSLSSIICFKKIMKNFKKIFIFFTILIYIGYFLFNLGFLLIYSGGEPTLNLYNQGPIYDEHYSHTEEIISINWFDKNHQTSVIYMDPYSELKIYAFGNPLLLHDKKIIPFFMGKSSYVYSNYVNKIKKINYWDAREKFNHGILVFNFPTEFLNDNKNKIYNNGGSEIFR